MTAPRNWALTATLAAGLAVAACTPTDIVSGPAPGSVEPATAIDWEAARTVTLRIRQSEFEPPVLSVVEGRPYVLRIENDDDIAHAFVADEFFANITAHGLSPDRAVAPGARVAAIALPPRTARELRFVPDRYGEYEFRDGTPGIFAAGGHLGPFDRGTYGVVGVIDVRR